MTLKGLHILSIVVLTAVLPGGGLSAQETLKASRVEARGARRHLPALGLPIKADGGIDHLVRYDVPVWTGREEGKAAPKWLMCELRPGSQLPGGIPEEVRALCQKWLSETPKAARLSIVFGPYGKGSFVALCRKTLKSLGWKSIGFLIPGEGIPSGASIYRNSMSINRLERMTGYDLFPKLPAHLQEIVEEMTSTELLSPVQEFDIPEADGIEQEREWDMEEDYREMG